MTTQTKTATYSIDPTHSTVEFSVKHMMIATVRGRFGEFDGTIRVDEADPTQSTAEATIQTASVDTGVAMRDDDLRSDNFLDAQRFPVMRFESTAVEQTDEEHWRVRGNLTIRDRTHEIVLDTALEGRGPDFEGRDRIGLVAETEINRPDFGLTYNALLETGNMVVGERVKVALHLELVRDA